jgi:eukaryotic-like serine/threonine-protein kinase
LTQQSETAVETLGRRYLLHEMLGEGSMGAVYRATDRLTRQTIALKRVKIKPEQLDSVVEGESVSLQFTLAQEFKILASMRHPNIISVLDYGFDEMRQPYVTMEMLEGAVAINQAAREQELDYKINLLIQMGQALLYLHRRNILHRDLKPKNVMVIFPPDKGGEPQVKVLDFGLSIPREEAQEGEIAGTPSFMAPELWIGDPASKSSDLYAFGVIAYELFAGKLPFSGRNIKELYEKVNEELPDLAPLKVDSEIGWMIARLLAKSPEDRYDDVGEVLAILRRFGSQSAPLETAATRESFLQAASFVGRRQEMATLTRALESLEEGRGSFWLIAGESGVGKSRLLDEARTLALVQGANVLRGQAIQEVSLPYAEWRDILRWLCLVTPLDEREASVMKALVPDIDDLLGYDVPEAPQTSAQADQIRLWMTIEQLFRRQSKALVLMLEDIQWAESESLLLLNRLGQVAGQMGLLLIASVRSEESPNLSFLLPSAQVMMLERLSQKNTAELLKAMLGLENVPKTLLELIQRETEGNAFFLVEVVRALAEEVGELGYVASGPLPTQVFTGGVQGIIRRRLSRVPEAARPLLQVAAIAGRQLDLALIREVFDQFKLAVNLDSLLNDCADAAVLNVQEGVWQFSHAKLRDGVLVDMPANIRQELQRRVALGMEAVYQYSSKQTAAALAYHWGEAGDVIKEEHYAALAGEQAMKNGAYQSAVGFFARALELQEQGNAPQRKIAGLQLQLGNAYLAMSDYASAVEVYQSVVPLCREINYQWGLASGLNSLGNATLELGDADQAAEYLMEALKIAMNTRALQVAVSVLVSMAGLLDKADGDKSVALEFVSMALNHPASDGQTHYLAKRLQPILQEQLPPEAAAEALEAGRVKSLREVAARILEE